MGYPDITEQWTLYNGRKSEASLTRTGENKLALLTDTDTIQPVAAPDFYPVVINHATNLPAQQMHNVILVIGLNLANNVLLPWRYKFLLLYYLPRRVAELKVTDVINAPITPLQQELCDALNSIDLHSVVEYTNQFLGLAILLGPDAVQYLLQVEKNFHRPDENLLDTVLIRTFVAGMLGDPKALGFDILTLPGSPDLTAAMNALRSSNLIKMSA